MHANENGVYKNCEIVKLPLPNKNYKEVEIKLAVDDDDHLWRYGTSCMKSDCGHSHPAFKKYGEQYDNRDSALAAGLRKMIELYPDLKPVLIRSKFAMILLEEQQLTLF